LRALCDDDALNGGTPQAWELSAPVPRPKEGSFPELANFPEAPGAGLEYSSGYHGNACVLLRDTKDSYSL